MKNILYVFLGGGIGSVLRYLLFLLIPSTIFPFATFAVNIAGSFLIGLLAGLYGMSASMQSSHHGLLLFLATGLCGGFTTFSTFSKESFGLMQQQQWGLFFVYVFLSVMLCIGGTALGFYLGK